MARPYLGASTQTISRCIDRGMLDMLIDKCMCIHICIHICIDIGILDMLIDACIMA